MTDYDASGDQALEPVQTLQPGDVDRLRLGWWSRIGASEVRQLLEGAPGLSLWIPVSHEHILVGPWRHRSDVAHLIDLVAIRHPIELTHAAIEQAEVVLRDIMMVRVFGHVLPGRMVGSSPLL